MSEVGLLWIAYIYIYGSYFWIHSASLCLLVRAFTLFKFEVIIDICVPIIIFGLSIFGVCFCHFLPLCFTPKEVPLGLIVAFFF